MTDMLGNTMNTEDKKGGFKLGFKLATKTEVVGSCGIVFEGKFYIYGGKTEKKQISVVKYCELERVPYVELAHDLERGACTVGNGQIYLCFNADGRQKQKTCYTADKPDSDFAANITESKYEHRLIRIASSESKL